ncbi:DUF6069 family protein [Nonomuraea sp. 10N515B]|uniref:DUF6069 family protein n=1 Tax=Nonomuraea sp. 10N515B TaxID=3457422 RepID=UPI003FCC91D1
MSCVEPPGRNRPPQQTFVRVALALSTVWFTLPLAPSHTTTSARLLLAGGHVLAAAIVIPGLTWTHAPEDLDEISVGGVGSGRGCS